MTGLPLLLEYEVDFVTAINHRVADRYRECNPHIHVLRNATNYENFVREDYRPVPMLQELRESGRPLLGYSGIINRIRVGQLASIEVVTGRPSEVWRLSSAG